MSLRKGIFFKHWQPFHISFMAQFKFHSVSRWILELKMLVEIYRILKGFLSLYSVTNGEEYNWNIFFSFTYHWLFLIWIKLGYLATYLFWLFPWLDVGNILFVHCIELNGNLNRRGTFRNRTATLITRHYTLHPTSICLCCLKFQSLINPLKYREPGTQMNFKEDSCKEMHDSILCMACTLDTRQQTVKVFQRNRKRPHISGD